MAKDKKEKATSDEFALPEGRVINESLFVKDQFNDKAVPSYKIEIAVENGSKALEKFQDKLMDFADEFWGEGAGDDEDLVLPLISGNKLAKKREKKGKDGSAYKGMTVIRAKTIYNTDGNDGPGGIQVFDEDVEEVVPAQQRVIYRGCYGIAGVTIGAYEDDDGNNALTLYLTAFQKTGEGEHLTSSADRSTLFKPKQRSEGGSNRGKKKRKSRRDDDD